MKALLVYVPIPERKGTSFHPGLERRYGEVLPALQCFCREHDCDLYRDLRFSQKLLEHPMHLDPDFKCLTYGDEGGRRGAGMVNMVEGDLLVFYGGLRPVHRCEQKLIYALMGMYVVQEVVAAANVPPQQWYENAHVRKAKPGETDIVIRKTQVHCGPRVSRRRKQGTHLPRSTGCRRQGHR